jgi:tRNA(Arg) A34 adenosine deaminase TadA
MDIKIDYDIITKKLIEFAKKSNVNQRHSAAIINGNNIFNIGINKYCTNKKLSTIHAEIDTLFAFKTKYKKIIDGVDIIVIRVNNSNNVINLKNSRPCSKCIETLQKYNIRKVYYSNEFGNIVYENIQEMQKRHISSGYKYKSKNYPIIKK